MHSFPSNVYGSTVIQEPYYTTHAQCMLHPHISREGASNDVKVLRAEGILVDRIAMVTELGILPSFRGWKYHVLHYSPFDFHSLRNILLIIFSSQVCCISDKTLTQQSNLQFQPEPFKIMHMCSCFATHANLQYKISCGDAKNSCRSILSALQAVVTFFSNNIVVVRVSLSHGYIIAP